MKLVLGGINGIYLRDIVSSVEGKVEEVVAAVAYATETALLFDWCWSNKIPLRFYGRLDEGVAVSIPVLQSFLARKSPNYICRLVQKHHAKIIWWKGAGIYIGSANLTQSAWNSNVEAGCFFTEEEISDTTAAEINDLLNILHDNSAPLTEEIFRVLKIRAFELGKLKLSEESFWKESSIKAWGGLVHRSPKNAIDQRRSRFLEEWYSTLQEIRDIGAIISRPENRPVWIPDSIPTGAQADQFLHAHYYQRTFEDGKARYILHFEKNKNRRAEALDETIDWWRRLQSAPMTEESMLTVDAPFLRDALSSEGLKTMTQDTFTAVCSRVHAIRDYSRRVANDSVKLPGGRRYTIEEKVYALSSRIWSDRCGNGSRVTEQLNYILHEGKVDDLPARLWEAVSNSKWKIEGLGVSALGEVVGWALPHKFPPRNGRTSKALKSLGYDVAVHVE